VFKLIECTNLDIHDAACLHAVNILQHPRSRPTTTSINDAMVNAPKKNSLPLLASKYGKSTQCSTQLCHKANEGNSSTQAQRVRALGACAASDQNRSFHQRKDETHMIQTNQRKRNGSRIRWIERPLWQENQFNMQRQQLYNSRKI